jgi:type IV pilus assembly protein PilE
MNKFIRGFTLIELMIVIAVLAIIIAIGYPSYRDQVMKARRADGKAFLLEIADRQERYYSDQSTYTTDITDLGFTNAVATDGYYQAAITDDPTGDLTLSYTITVTPIGTQTDDRCASFTVTSQGTRTASPADCWE